MGLSTKKIQTRPQKQKLVNLMSPSFSPGWKNSTVEFFMRWVVTRHWVWTWSCCWSCWKCGCRYDYWRVVYWRVAGEVVGIFGGWGCCCGGDCRDPWLLRRLLWRRLLRFDCLGGCCGGDLIFVVKREIGGWDFDMWDEIKEVSV